MYIKSVEVRDIKSYEFAHVDFSPGINIIVGANNSGKSTIINAINHIQTENINQFGMQINIDALRPRVNKQEGNVSIVLGDIESYKKVLTKYLNGGKQIDANYVGTMNGNITDRVSYEIKRDQKPNHIDFLSIEQQNNNIFNRRINSLKFSNLEPLNIIYPFLAKRKISNIILQVDEKGIRNISGNFDYLVPKIDSLCQRHHEFHDDYMDICKSILGFHVTTAYDGTSKNAGLYISSDDMIPITSMGEGVLHLLALIVNLCTAHNKIFLIEEPENDIHPKALKDILSLIEQKSATNQFIISTHSNIVTKYLGGVEGTKLFKVSMALNAQNKLPVSNIKELNNDVTERQLALEELGYEIYDNELWKAWLFLEESSAESIIRDYLIPTFVNELATVLRTFSTNGIDQVKTKVEDFHKLFVYLHLTPIYKNKVWVIVDNGEHELNELNKIKDHYVKKHSWEKDNFQQFKEHDFENYYPERFETQRKEVLGIKNDAERARKKKELLVSVLAWTQAEPKQAKVEFAESAKEVIEILKSIATKLK